MPWSFVQTDNLWNLVLACSDCNTKKSDKITTRLFLESMLERNESLVSVVGETSDFYTYEDKKLVDLYDYSIINGYTVLWEPGEVYK
ncbi:HNH endonuclease domain-containing protein [Solibacillus sp. FSL H8-0538]|uniref:HNH endonuclease domain-containing protein n=1 Tax=Solibacillus sp. FSL H8-0538 TaxID=2921400 RepID=UPI004046FDF4